MPYSDHPPVAVYPDTFQGHCDRDREMRQGYVPHAFCSEFAPDPDSSGMHVRGRGVWCANREPTGDRAHNWCFRCIAGFREWADPRDSLDPFSETTREVAPISL